MVATYLSALRTLSEMPMRSMVVFLVAVGIVDVGEETTNFLF